MYIIIYTKFFRNDGAQMVHYYTTLVKNDREYLKKSKFFVFDIQDIGIMEVKCIS